jgi:ATP-dependent Clp protease adaptor protein ClpS
MAQAAPVEVDRPIDESDVTPDVPWIVIVWNDPINLMSYVVYVFQKLFGYPREKATKLMMDVHVKGRAVVSEGPRERCERRRRLHAHGSATLQKDRVPIARVKRLRRGGFALRIPPPERDVLAAVPPMLRSLLAGGDDRDPAMRRLFPSAFMDDEAAAAEFDSVVRDDLLEQRLAAIDTMERTLRAERLSEEELVAWLAAVNDLRLCLGCGCR